MPTNKKPATKIALLKAAVTENVVFATSTPDKTV